MFEIGRYCCKSGTTLRRFIKYPRKIGYFVQYRARFPAVTSAFGLQSKLRLARLVLVGLWPVARQIAARSRLCAGEGWAGFSCNPVAAVRLHAFLMAST